MAVQAFTQALTKARVGVHADARAIGTGDVERHKRIVRAHIDFPAARSALEQLAVAAESAHDAAAERSKIALRTE
jgi:hypothetical protein